MKKRVIKAALLCIAIGLAGCATNMSKHKNMDASKGAAGSSATNPASQGATNTMQPGPAGMSGSLIGGSIGSGMGEADMAKLSHGMDSPVGKSTHWISNSNGTAYTITPVKKVTINGNHNCREYHLTADMSGRVRQFDGVACVAADAEWHANN